MRRPVIPQLLLVGLLACALLPRPVARADDDGPWPDIRQELFKDRPIEDAAGIIALDAPLRAYDAAIVPITVTAQLPQAAGRSIRSIALIVDKNPAPVVGTFHFTADSGLASFATRVRINEYTTIRAVAETSDGHLYMATRFVKAAGGCSAPALKDAEKALAQLGRLKLRQPEAVLLGRPNQAQLLISHPNYSGMQFDQISRNYIPAHFIESIEVRYDDRPIITVDANISLSEDPSIHFYFVPKAAGRLAVEVRDSAGMVFRDSWPVTPAPAS